jgi:regulator of sigma E protease
MHTFLVSVVSFVIVLGILVLVHEFGHFLAAKLCGVRVEQFSIGFPPRLFGIKDRRHRLLHLRHSTRRLRQDDRRVDARRKHVSAKLGADGEHHRGAEARPRSALTSHPRWQRIIIGLAGPFANFALALT